MSVAARTARLPWSTSGAIVSGSVLQPLNSSMIALAIVGLTLEFGPSHQLPWVISAMYIGTAVAAPVSGRLGALVGARRVYVAGLALVLAGSVLGLVASNLTWVVISRVVVGIGAATQYPNAVALVRRYARRHDTRTDGALGLLNIGAQVTVALGPAVGGLLVGVLGWRAVMWVNLPVVVVSALLVWALVDRDDPVSRGGSGLLSALDLPGIGLFLAWLVPLMLFLLSVPDGPRWWLLPVIAAATTLFVVRERRAGAPFLDVSAVLHDRALSGTLLRTLLGYTAYYSVYFGLPQWLQIGRGWSAAQAGLVMLPCAVVGMVCSVLATRTCRTAGPRRALGWGTVALAAAGVTMALGTGTELVVVIIAIAVLTGIPTGFNNIGNQTVVDRSTADTEVGTAMGLYRTTQFVGANFAAVVLAACAGQQVTDGGFVLVGWAVVILTVLLLVVTFADRSLIPRAPEAATSGPDQDRRRPAARSTG